MSEDFKLKILETKINQIEDKLAKIDKALQGNGSMGLHARISLIEREIESIQQNRETTCPMKSRLSLVENEVEKIAESIKAIKSLLWGEEGNQENSLLVIISRLNTKLDIYSVIVAGLGSLITGLAMYFGK
jgi:hypothetical protein